VHLVTLVVPVVLVVLLLLLLLLLMALVLPNQRVQTAAAAVENPLERRCVVTNFFCHCSTHIFCLCCCCRLCFYLFHVAFLFNPFSCFSMHAISSNHTRDGVQ
jgi:ABC-type sulfate transport system permease component